MSVFSTSDFLQTLRQAALASFALFLPIAASAQTITGFAPTSATAGTSVVITGLNLGSAKSVLLNGMSLKITANTATAITVTIPVAASTGKLVVTTVTVGVLAASQLGITRGSSGIYFPSSRPRALHLAAFRWPLPPTQR